MKVKNREVDSAPFAVVEITKGGKHLATIRCWWTANGGTYGHQVAWQAYLDESHSGITGGCGYCKESSAFEHALHALGLPSNHNALDAIKSNHHVGGNYSKLTLTALKRIVKNLR